MRNNTPLRPATIRDAGLALAAAGLALAVFLGSAPSWASPDAAYKEQLDALRAEVAVLRTEVRRAQSVDLFAIVDARGSKLVLDGLQDNPRGFQLVKAEYKVNGQLLRTDDFNSFAGRRAAAEQKNITHQLPAGEHLLSVTLTLRARTIGAQNNVEGLTLTMSSETKLETGPEAPTRVRVLAEVVDLTAEVQDRLKIRIEATR